MVTALFKGAPLRPPPRTPSELKPLDRALIQTIMFELGILPMEDTAHDMRRPMKELPPEEARVLKRRFRKLWRKVARKMATRFHERPIVNGAKSPTDVAFGKGKRIPTRNEREERKRAVFNYVWNEYIAEVVYRFEHPDEQEQGS